MAIRRRNHFAAQGYLKRWAQDGKKLWVYRTLVSRERVRFWELKSIEGVAKLDHLYTQFAEGRPDDVVERWLDSQIDSPSAVVLDRVAAEEKLTPHDYDVLVRFFAASHARTPAFMFRRRAEWEQQIPDLMKATIERSVTAQVNESSVRNVDSPSVAPIEIPSPFRVRVRPNAKGDGRVVEAQGVIGRSLWVHHIVRWVHTANRHLRRAPWAIRRAPAGRQWFTSDDPAVIASVSREKKVTLGRVVEGQQVSAFIALDPSHVLHAKFGGRAFGRYAEMDEAEADFIQRCIVMNAHRLVFSACEDQWVATVRTRRVDAGKVVQEQEAWRSWPAEQRLAELALTDESTWPEVASQRLPSIAPEGDA